MGLVGFAETFEFDGVSFDDPQINPISFLCCDFPVSSTTVAVQGLLLPEKLGHGLDFPDIIGGLELDKLFARMAVRKN